MILDQVNYPINILHGIGKNYTQIFKMQGLNTIGDLLKYFPRTFSDRTKTATLQEACRMDSSTVKVKIIEHRLTGRSYKKILKIIINDGNTFAALVCFNRNFLENTLKVGNEFFITGKFYFNYQEIQCSNFEYEEIDSDFASRIIPVYPLKEGFTQKILRKVIDDALSKYRLDIEDELPFDFIKTRDLLNKRDAVKNVHFPDNFNIYIKAKKTFIYEEFFYQRLFLLKRKESLKKLNKIRAKINFNYKNDFLKLLPFQLTDYQVNALNEIEKDIFSDHVFSRLLQGDVGSGKTVVALLSMLSVVESGYQTALLAPTEVLAIQHFNVIKEYMDKLNINCSLLTGSMKKEQRIKILNGLKSGEIKLIVGTHSLFTPDVIYKNLGFAVIDEQQRFGVEQRYQLLSKGEGVDLLLMTATPIPRSLAMSLFGDLDLTVMKGTIKGRLPVKTWHLNNEGQRINNMHDWIKKTISEEDGRAIFVYPAIEETEDQYFKNLKTEYKNLLNVYKDFNPIFIHSKVSGDEKIKSMNDFRSGKSKILLATTIIEVGIDIPDANIVVVENADNYGLSTLHQIRGRVGRNNKQAYMVLITDNERLTEIGKKRLEVMTKTNDGFEIAEEDLLLRGPGDFIGYRQSGLPDYKFADIRRDIDILKESSEDAEILFKNDPDFNKQENYNIKLSFYNRLKTYIEYYQKSDA